MKKVPLPQVAGLAKTEVADESVQYDSERLDVDPVVIEGAVMLTVNGLQTGAGCCMMRLGVGLVVSVVVLTIAHPNEFVPFT